MKIRAFIAINLSENTKEEIAKIILELKRLNPSKTIKWVATKNLHLTLYFLGYLNEEELSVVKNVLIYDLKTKINRKIILNFKNFVAFPNLLYPRILGMEISKSANRKIIEKLRNQIGEGLKNKKFNIDKRQWRMHLTLARIKFPTNIHLPTSYKNKDINLKFHVQSIDLMKSELSKTGPTYSIIESYPLF